jgi:chromosome segregation protein
MRLKSLELFGYKTFASRTNLEFPGMITAIVGPNGSGKSNITDGLRWVLGEQSYSLLRGKKTEDMIFTGSEQRPRAGMAACTIVFDNATGWLPIDYSEVAITRRAYRDGQNEYLLNGQKVRLKDISELLAQSGLSERNYAIIGQGLIDNSLALRPEERRKLFEEAAGIGLYRGRRLESINRLETTHRNMERVRDILVELEPRLVILEKQAKKAEEYERIKADLKLVLREWYGYHWHLGQAEITKSREQQKSMETSLDQVKLRHEMLNQQIQATRATIQTLRDKITSLRAVSTDLLAKKELISRDLAVSNERYRALKAAVSTAENETLRLNGEIQTNKESIHEIQAEVDEINVDLQASARKEADALAVFKAAQGQKDTLAAQISSLRSTHTEVETSLVRLRTQADEKKTRITSLEASIADLKTSEIQLQKAVQEAKAASQKSEAVQEGIENQEAGIVARLTELNGKKDLLDTQINVLAKEKARLDRETTRLQMEIDLLEQAEKNLVGYPSGAKTILQAIRKGEIAGLAAAISSQIVVKEEYDVAISAVLGEFTDAVVVKDAEDANKSLASLENDQPGRTAIIYHTKAETRNPGHVDHPWIIGKALNFVKFPSNYQQIMELLLGNVLIIKDRTQLKELLAWQDQGVIFVTLKGEVFYPDGRVIGGRQTKSSQLARPRQQVDLRQQVERLLPLLDDTNLDLEEKHNNQESIIRELQQLQEAKKILDGNLSSASNDAQRAQIQLEKATRQLEWTVSQLQAIESEISQAAISIDQLTTQVKEKQERSAAVSEQIKIALDADAGINLDEPRRDLAFIQTTHAVNQRAINELQKRIGEKEASLRANEGAIITVQNRIKQAEAELAAIEATKGAHTIEEGQLSENIQLIQSQIQPAEQQLKETEKAFTDLLSADEASQQQVNAAERYYAQAQMEVLRRKESMESLRRRIEEDFGLVNFDYAEDVSGPNPLPFEGMVEQLPVIKSIPPELEESITRQKSLLRRLGAINPEAKEEYDSTRERFEFLTQQIEDLTAADTNLRQILSDLDTLMKSEFKKTFDAVADEFPRMFSRLFGGGSARLVMSDPEDLNESGIEIHARLPGKREQELTLLSGGERSLTAVALIFALLKVSPTPFCVLDEVDAMLDESNVGRFRDLLLELSQEIQFILVTHNRNTVQAANIIYGITMGRDSSSQMISLKLDEVPEEMLSRSR